MINGEGEVLVPAHLNFGKFVLERLRNANPDDTCLVNCDTGEELTFGSFLTHATRLSSALAALGARRGRTVAVAGETRATYLPTTLAVILTGATVTPIELECGRTVLAHKFNLTRPSYVICSRLFWESYSDILKGLDYIETVICFDEIADVQSVATLMSRARHVDVTTYEPAVVSGDDVAVIMYSSGTTGESKGVVLTHLNCIVRTDIKWYHGIESVQIVFIINEICSTYIFYLMYYFLTIGKKVVCSDKTIDLKTLQDYQVNTFPAVPLALEEILNAERSEEYDLSALKTIYCAAGPVHPLLAKAFSERYPHIKILRLYGATEVDVLSVQSPTDTDNATVGIPAPGVTFKVVDMETRAILGPNQRGEICVRTPALMKGYLGSSGSEYLDKEGFYLTGDLGYYDDHKRFYLVGRLKDFVSYLGYKVSPGEVEAVLLAHPAVAEAAVVGRPVGARGEAPTAFVVLRPGHTVTEDELVQYVDKEVTWYMRLAGGVRFVSELPRSGLRKVMRRRLRELLDNEH